jgi:hypothetical protein
MCRKLLDAGFDPARPLEAYRGEILCLTVSSIGWGAKHTVAENNREGPYLVRWKSFQGPGARPPIAPAEVDA